jgi:hypothetical protein
MIYAEVLCEWSGDGLSRATANRPRILDDYPQDVYPYKYEDVTGQETAQLTPDPNLFVIGITCEQTLLDLLEADPDYEVLWSEEL